MRAWLLASIAAGCGFREVDSACFVYVVASDSHSCARRTDGTLWCWGNNQYGQLGMGDSDGRPRPTSVDPSGIAGDVTGIYVPTGSGGISSRTAFTCALRSDGTLWCFGSNEYGQLGTGDTDHRFAPAQVDPESGFGDVHAVSAGSGYACARKNDNSIWCWGANELGQLGTGDMEPRLRPVQVAELGTDVRYLVTGSSHTCARKTDGTLWCWGANQYGQLGTGDTEPRASPVQIDPENLGGNVDVVVAGAFHTCVTRTDSTMWCWGANQFGQLGVAGSMPRLVPVPLDFPDLAGGVPLVSAGGFHTCAAKTDGSLSCWGSNREGQLGSGTVENSATPLEVEADSFGRSTAVVYAGGAHTCARSSDSSLWCWGSNQFGQLGIGLGPGTNTPIRVSPACF